MKQDHRRWDGTTVAITGGAGFLGSHLAEHLAGLGARVLALDNLSAADPAGLAALRGTQRVDLIHADILQPAPLARALDGADYVVHMAAISNPRACKEDIGRAFDVNVVGVKNVLEATPAARRAVFLSSAWVYGDPVALPMDETHPTNGSDPYSLGKLMGELVCRSYLDIGRDVTIVRNFNTFGPRQAGGFLIPTVITQAIRDGRVEIWNGDPIRDFLFVDDFVAALVALLRVPQAAGRTVNVGRGEGTRVGDLGREVASILGVEYADRGQPVTGSRELVCGNRALKELTGWAPRVSLREGLSRTIEHFRVTLAPAAAR